MSIVIRHGSNGAFKTANSVGEYLIPAIQQGRIVVTNIRGVSRQRCYEKFPDLPESMDIIYVDTQTTEGRLHMAKWFHWAPPGALLIFDEASSVFPKSWRQSDLDKLNYPGGTDKAKEDDRPENWLQAFEMHRHWNWDIVLTTPNIKNIRDDIRNTTEMAYRQRNLGSLSEKLGRFKEVQHDAAKNGFSASDAISMTVKKVNKDAFDLYDSTTTGIVKGSQAGQSLLKNPKVLLLLGVLMACLGTVVYLGAPGFTGEPDTTTNTSKSAETTGQVVTATHVPGPEMVPRVHPGKVVGVPHDRLPNGLPVAGVPVVDSF
ncbi:hypothetical protein BTA51_25980 [Hahella sp. CCB-MM4]|uniref:zonular occludens toxin domain-containing protein n=1 Tax=Hahella sp. (strain CCB-MM4) TaxID=1926491 RepID=UPI000B9BAB30|nr:zonular occludens toxin domain-containing protein [Hahella sp. CCB-MM4]OZG70420.1 hypothetical protein BTA51_25980 [Hahella sp. CCB-MM4]